ncbi:hypothetical protein WS71_22340 [Burkholderia mayonis]|uniref:Uncharacterized protein n=1 Tax=Burkholderia mayonis TaxID=1385591 RepID=A0A1B4G251_9BURK|nr:hypothetical protein WS71_22340 [Burkholderia mayonis]KVE50715.1 hypothetical protein WS71_00320 [Burkholderia mayonis]
MGRGAITVRFWVVTASTAAQAVEGGEMVAVALVVLTLHQGGTVLTVMVVQAVMEMLCMAATLERAALAV